MARPRMTAPRPGELAPRLLVWFETSGRDLPWRRTRDSYRIWVSEVMLQQTQVERVQGYYERFLASFPTLQALASSSIDDVLRAWAGLGYYRRAHDLHAAARAIVARHQGQFPRSYQAARALPGVGAYTAGAVLSIAHGQRLPALDANARRALARLLAEPADNAASRARLQRFGEVAVSERHPGAYNQALMELGALLCLPRQPRCDRCPLGGLCRARRTGRESAFPARRAGSTRRAEAAVAVATRRGRVLLAQRPLKGVWGGLWEFPQAEVRGGERAAEVLARTLWDGFGLRAQPGGVIARLTYSIMNSRVALAAYAFAVVGGRTRPRAHRDAAWVRPSELAGLALPAPHRRLANQLAAGAPQTVSGGARPDEGRP